MTLDGLLTFFASHHAVRAEKVLGDAGFAVELVPGPKELSPNCGVALRLRFDRTDEALGVLEAASVEVDEVHRYVARTDAWPGRRRRRARS
ncbi:MAG: DUF3343 domain-containing protein [Acidimicrobiia bacterium]|nr:DUF3343 domain-containing protein [Acidimicrobiia bacterium]